MHEEDVMSAPDMRLVSMRIRDGFHRALPTGEELCNDVHKRREHVCFPKPPSHGRLQSS
jgi:hypothetical protein